VYFMGLRLTLPLPVPIGLLTLKGANVLQSPLSMCGGYKILSVHLKPQIVLNVNEMASK
jgi:hypothetical protein